jgi:hypothetical protein
VLVNISELGILHEGRIVSLRGKCAETQDKAGHKAKHEFHFHSFSYQPAHILAPLGLNRELISLEVERETA